MSDLRSKRKYAGPTVQEIRRTDQDPAKVPPHAKKRTYLLTIIETTVSVGRDTLKFPSRAARDQAKAAIEKKKQRHLYWWRNSDKHHTNTTREYEESEE